MSVPSAGRIAPWPVLAGSHSHTWPASNSSHESHVPHGVRPPAQFALRAGEDAVGRRDLAARRAKRIAELPAPVAAVDSEFETRIQPPSAVANVAWPSLKMCHG